MSVNRAELKDFYFEWDDFASTINVDLNDVVGNFIHRTITFTIQHFEGKIPERGQLSSIEKDLFVNIEENIKSYFEAMDNFKIKDATNISVNIARLGNQYFSSVEPWHLIKKDKDRTGTVLNLSAKISEIISILLWPIMPNASEKIWSALGFKGKPKDAGIESIDLNKLNTGQKIKKTKPIFYKVKENDIKNNLKEIREKAKKKEKESGNEMNKITYEEFKNVQLRIATIKSATPIEKSKNLIKLQIDLGTEERQILAGIKQYYEPEKLVGKQIVVVTNLQPATLMGEKSDGMLLAADIDGEPILLNLDKEVPPGTEVK